MTAVINIQTADLGTTGENDSNKETATMKVQSKIQGIIRNNLKVLTGVIVAGMIATASIIPGIASADIPARPAADVESLSSISSTSLNLHEVDEWVSLTYSEKLVTANTPRIIGFAEVDDWVSLTYSEKLVPANAPSIINFAEVDNWVSLTYSEKLVPANAIGAMTFAEVDDWVSLTYSE